MKKYILFLSFFVLFFLRFASVHAEVVISATVDKTKITNEDEISLLITVKGSSNASEPLLPSMPGFTVVSSGKSSSIQIINGNTTISKQYQYVLIPGEEGNFTLGSITVTSEGKTYSTKPIQIVVGSTVNQPNQGNPVISNPQNKDFWITAEVSNQNPYVNEQVVYIFRFYTKVPVLKALLTTPSFKDFWFEEVVPEKKYEHEVNGDKYIISEKRVALFAFKSGQYTIDSTQLDLYIQNTSTPFNNPFYTTKSKVLKTKPITLDVKTLPAPAPDNFINFVGRTIHVASKISSNKAKVGDSLTFDLIFRGNGDINDILLPQKIDFGSMKRYDDKPTSEITRKDDGIEGVKNFSLSLIPTEPGNMKVGPLEFSYFDPEEKKYKTISTETFDLAIEPGEEPLVAQDHSEKTDNKEAEPKITQKEGPGFIEKIKIPRFMWVIAIFLSTMMTLLYLATSIGQKIKARTQDISRKKYKALKNFRKKIKKPTKENILNALRVYFSERFDLPPTISEAELSQFLKNKLENTENYRELLQTISLIGQSVYGGKDLDIKDSKLADIIYKNLKKIDSIQIKQAQKALLFLFLTPFFHIFNANAENTANFIEPGWVSLGRKIFVSGFVPDFEKFVFIFLIFWILFFLVLWVSLLKRKKMFKRKFFFFLAFLYTGLGSFFKYYTGYKMEWGVISANNVAVYSSFMEEEDTLGYLNEGVHVLIQNKRTFNDETSWVQVYWSPEKSGWIKSENLVSQPSL